MLGGLGGDGSSGFSGMKEEEKLSVFGGRRRRLNAENSLGSLALSGRQQAMRRRRSAGFMQLEETEGMVDSNSPPTGATAGREKDDRR